MSILLKGQIPMQVLTEEKWLLEEPPYEWHSSSEQVENLTKRSGSITCSYESTIVDEPLRVPF